MKTRLFLAPYWRWLMIVLVFLQHGLVICHAATLVSPTDPNIKYFGRWDESSPRAFSTGRWPGVYFRVNFTGTTVQVVLGSTTTSFEAKIDNSPYAIYTSTANATISLTPTPLADGTHTLTVVPHGDGSADFQFAGLVLDNSASAQLPTIGAYLIEFIGDSITVGYGSSDMPTMAYSWRTAERLNAEHTQISHGGMCLPDGYSNGVNTVGMSSSFSQRKNIEVTPTSSWDFATYTPRQVVVNLGTNDASRVPDAIFQEAYITLLARIRSNYPRAQIVALRPFGGQKTLQTQTAVTSRNAAGDANVYYVDTTGWLGPADYLDGIHPNDRGVVKIVNGLAPILLRLSGTIVVNNHSADF